jgi:hypothetical protein
MSGTTTQLSLRDVVKKSFFATHGGNSTDDVMIDDNLNAAFLKECQQHLPTASAADLNWELYNLRKQRPGMGNVTTVKQKRLKHDAYLHAAEIAARHMEDKHALTIDRVLCDPAMRAEFDGIAQGIVPGVSTYRLRKAALFLRKNRKLKPELLKRVANWGKTVVSYPAQALWDQPDLIPRQPGIYIFRNKTAGYLYIGEGGNLRGRVYQHLDHSDRKALCHYLLNNGMTDLTVELHAFQNDSDARKADCRKAYEADLIHSRQPQFNIQGA